MAVSGQIPPGKAQRLKALAQLGVGLGDLHPSAGQFNDVLRGLLGGLARAVVGRVVRPQTVRRKVDVARVASGPVKRGAWGQGKLRARRGQKGKNRGQSEGAEPKGRAELGRKKHGLQLDRAWGLMSKNSVQGHKKPGLKSIFENK